jgi:hypothetical protein
MEVIDIDQHTFHWGAPPTVALEQFHTPQLGMVFILLLSHFWKTSLLNFLDLLKVVLSFLHQCTIDYEESIGISEYQGSLGH